MLRMISVLTAGVLALGATAAAQTGGTEKSRLPPGTAVRAELQHSLDSKKVKVGDSVVARTTEDVKEDGRVVLPKGSKVTGHVTEASARSKGDNNSRLALAFDRAELKGGQEIPFEANLQALAAAPSAAAPIGGQDLEAGGSPNSTQGTSSRGGMAGASGTSGRTSNPPPRPIDNTPTVGSTESGGGSAPIKADAHGVFGLDGLTLETNSPNPLIVSSGKSVRLDGGTRLLLVTPAN